MQSNIDHSSMPLISLKKVSKTFITPSGEFHAVRDISLEIDYGTLLVINGKSGSGKSTLLNLITGIDKPTNGKIIISGTELSLLSESELSKWRGKNIGVVFQFFQLLPTLTILENIMLPMDFNNSFNKKERRDRAMQLLEQVSIREQADKFPYALSGGQQQRAAIARALANDPSIIVADEPTGNLDSQNAGAVLALFLDLSQAGKTIIMVTHEKELTQYFPNSLTLSDGSIISSKGVMLNETIS